MNAYFNSYYHLILEKDIIEIELKYHKVKLDKLCYSGVKDVKSPVYDTIKSPIGSTNITTFFIDIIDETKIIAILEESLKTVNASLSEIKKKINEYSNLLNDIELQVFKKHFIELMPLSQVLISKKNSSEFYSYKQILRIKDRILQKITQNEEKSPLNVLKPNL